MGERETEKENKKVRRKEVDGEEKGNISEEKRKQGSQASMGSQRFGHDLATEQQ